MQTEPKKTKNPIPKFENSRIKIMKKSKEKAETTKIDTLTTAELKAMLKAISHTASAKHPELDDLVYIEACPSVQ